MISMKYALSESITSVISPLHVDIPIGTSKGVDCDKAVIAQNDVLTNNSICKVKPVTYLNCFGTKKITNESSMDA